LKQVLLEGTQRHVKINATCIGGLGKKNIIT